MSLLFLRWSPASQRRLGFTLIEALIAVTMTLIIMLALAQGFKRLSDDISKGRARLSLSDQLRGVSEILRNDLAGLTVDCDPTAKTTKSGYFLYYEGPIADHHPVTVPINNLPGGTTEEQLSTSKYGDFDDILMFTARSKGDWFRGRVPLAIVKGVASGGNYTSTLSDWTQTVVVASEYAEIAYFMMPGIVPTSNGTYEQYIANPNLTLPIIDRDSPVNPSPTPAMPAYFTPTGNGIPDRFTLCRRVLLILPNLNLATGQLFNSGAFGSAIQLQSNNVSNATGSRLMLANAYQRCDLSVRRVPSMLTAAPIAANSLDDLANPLNRFAHVTLPGPVVGAGALQRTMPMLSLSGPLALQRYAVEPNISLAPRTTETPNTFPECGFMRPEFLKRTFDPTTGAVQLVENPETGGDVELLSNEEVLASNCIAFDLKGYDPIARLLYHNGADGLPNPTQTTTPTWATLGASGSDDLVVSPSDPGYYDPLSYIGTGMPAATIETITASQGAFVDLGWAMKSPSFANGVAVQPNTTTAARRIVFQTALSGLDSNSAVAPPVICPPFQSLRKSGSIVGTLPTVSPYTPFVASIFQPHFDSYTDAFEHDGFKQMISLIGTVFVDGKDYIEGTSVNLMPSTTDLASNGLDDAVSGATNGLIDDYDEQDSSPPILSAMPAIQALIRLEDVSAGVIQQIAVTHDLVSQ